VYRHMETGTAVALTANTCGLGDAFGLYLFTRLYPSASAR